MGMCGSKIKFLGDDIVDIAFKTVDKLYGIKMIWLHERSVN